MYKNNKKIIHTRDGDAASYLSYSLHNTLIPVTLKTIYFSLVLFLTISFSITYSLIGFNMRKAIACKSVHQFQRNQRFTNSSLSKLS